MPIRRLRLTYISSLSDAVHYDALSTYDLLYNSIVLAYKILETTLRRKIMEKIYNKLIRDNIPQMIKENGGTPVIRKLDDKEYFECLNFKLQEELDEYLEDYSIEEFCDILEVLEAIAKFKGFSAQQIVEVKARKATHNGVFDKRLFLEKVVQEDNK